MTPRRYWVDPQTQSAQQALQQKAQEAQQAKAEARAQEERLFSTQVLMADRDNRTSLVRHLTDLRFKYWKGVLDSEVEEFRVQAQGSEDIEPSVEQLEQQQAEGVERG